MANLSIISDSDNRTGPATVNSGVTYNLHIVPTWIRHERRIIVGMVLRPQAWLAIALPSRRDGSVMEGIDRFAI